MAELNHKIPAFTILESMISIVILMIAFSLSTLVIMNVTTSGMSREKQNAYILVKALKNETLLESRFIDESIIVDQLLIEKTMLDYGKGDQLKVLLIEAFKGKKKLFESKEIIVVKTE